MRLRLRLLLLIFRSLWRKPVKEFVESVLSLRVLPNDVDVTKVSNDRYVALMDLGRMDVAFQLGLLKTMVRKHWAPLATFCTVRFRHPLKVFQKYRLRTRIVYWDERTFYFLQEFERKGRIVATGLSCATLLGPEGPVSPEDIIEETGLLITRPEKPEIVSMLQNINKMIHQWQKDKDPIV